VTGNVLTGPEGSLLSAITTFVHTNLAHSSPYRFNWDETQDAFISHLQFTREILQLFDKKFNPDPKKRIGTDNLDKNTRKYNP